MLEKSGKIIFNRSVCIFFIVFVIFPHLKLRGQCLPGSLSRGCIDDIEEGFIYLKSYSIDGQNSSKEQVEYTAVMSKDTQYAFRICTSDEGADGIVLTIFDSNRNEIISNREENFIDPELNYLCTLTGIYYLRFTFYESKYRCGGCILSFRRSQD